jgi:CO/xanthine dehydrogenase Mo-binding subunit
MTEGKLLVKGKVPPPLDREFTVVGKPLNRTDGVEKVTGRAKYSGDITLPNMLYGKILRCPYPRARIVKIDTSKA